MKTEIIRRQSINMSKILKGHCPDCGPDRFADIVGHHCKRIDDDSGVWHQTDYRILQCRGCEHVYFQTEEIFSEDIDHEFNPATGDWEPYLPAKFTHYPAPSKRHPPEWTLDLDLEDRILGSLFSDIYGALNAELQIPAAIAVRTAFDRASELLKVDPALTFKEKLDELASQGKISADEKNSLAVLTDAGSAAAHRGWRPKPKELETMIAILENFLHRTFVIGSAADELKNSIPIKPKRQQKPKQAT